MARKAVIVRRVQRSEAATIRCCANDRKGTALAVPQKHSEIAASAAEVCLECFKAYLRG